MSEVGFPPRFCLVRSHVAVRTENKTRSSGSILRFVVGLGFLFCFGFFFSKGGNT